MSSEAVIADGPMGTMLIAQGFAAEAVLAANLTHPEAVRAVHVAYLEVGAEVLLANTSALPFYLSFAAVPGEKILNAALEQARAACGLCDKRAQIYIPLGPPAASSPSERRRAVDACLTWAAQAVKEGRAHGAWFETCGAADWDWLLPACLKAAQVGVEHVVTFLAEHQSDVRAGGLEVGAAFARFGSASALGFNCAAPAGARSLQRSLGAAATALAKIHLNPGQRRVFKPAASLAAGPIIQPADFAAIVRRSAAEIVGGCCGATPRHIAALAWSGEPPGAE